MDDQKAPSPSPHAPRCAPGTEGVAPDRPSRRRALRTSSLGQIDSAIATVTDQLQSPNLSTLDRLFLAGQLRELRAAHWLVSRLLPAPHAPISPPAMAETLPPPRRLLPPAALSSPVPYPPPPITPRSPRSLQAALFDAVAAKFSNSLRNLTPTPLEIDILQPDKKHELLILILRQIKDSLDDVRFSQLSPAQFAAKQAVILQDIWQAALTDFVGRYYTVQWSGQTVAVVDVVLGDRALIQTAILDKIPLAGEFMAHLLYQTPLTIDDATYLPGSIEAMQRLELVLENLTLSIANAVMQPLLNRFADVPAIKQALYDRRLLSTREIERFRNDLSWKYRLDRYFAEPTAIFESQHRLWTVQPDGISQTSIYFPRNQELATLAGIPLVVTLALEVRDAIAPRLRTATAFVGSGIVYVLTDIVGRGIGLIGRGIIKGIGTALQDVKPKRWR